MKQARRDKRLRQCDVAEALGVQQQAVSGWERGLHQPSAGHLAAFCTVVEVDPPTDGEPALNRPDFLLRAVPDPPSDDEGPVTRRVADEGRFIAEVMGPRLSAGAPLSDDEVAFFRDVARTVYGVPL